MKQQQWNDRWSSRQPVVLEVAVHNHEQSVVRGKTHDISIGGMFVEAHPLDLSLNDQVNVAFNLEKDGVINHHYLPARVIRLTDKGAGLMFSDFSPTTVNALKELLYAS